VPIGGKAQLRETAMLRVVLVSGLVMARVAAAGAGECQPAPTGGMLCERDGAVFHVDPATGRWEDVTQELMVGVVLGALLQGGVEADPEATAPDPAEEEASGMFEDRLAGFCAEGGCPTGLSGGIDGYTGYVPSYQ
jgi:hypothetical protein